MRQIFDQPGAAEQPPHERSDFERRFDKPIGPADHAQFVAQIDIRRGRTDGVERQKSDAAIQSFAVCGQIIEQPLARRDDNILCFFAERRFDQRRGFDTYLQQIGQQSADLLKRTFAVFAWRIRALAACRARRLRAAFPILPAARPAR